MLFGDSLFGRFGKELIPRLEAKLSGYDVYNCAAGGYDTNDCVQKGLYLSRLKPDVLMISLGTNDAAPWKQVELSAFTDNLKKIFTIFSDSKIVFFLPPPVDESKEIGNEKRMNEIVKQYHDAAKDLCKANNVKALDSWAVFKPMLDKGEDYHVEDGVHFNELGYKVLIDKLAELVEEVQ